MKKFLRAVRLDNSDDELYRVTGAAPEGAWVVSGGYAVCDLARGYRCKPRCHCDDAFLELAGTARCTIAEVVEIDDLVLTELTDTLTQHLLLHWKAPSEAVARSVAEEEVHYTAELCETFPNDVWITVKRSPNPAGEGIDEKYSVYDRLMLGAHRL